MAGSGLTRREKHTLAERIEAAFNRYADLQRGVCCYPSDSPEQSCNRIRACGKLFAELISASADMKRDSEMLDTINSLMDFPKVLISLSSVLASGCPALDIVELTLIAAGRFSLEPWRALEAQGFDVKLLGSMQQDATRMADLLERLNDVRIWGLRDSVADLRMPRRDKRRIRKLLSTMPEALRYAADLIEASNASSYDPDAQAYLKRAPLIYMYLVLNHFGAGYPLMSGLLTIVREIQPKDLPSDRHPSSRVRTEKREAQSPRSKGQDDGFSAAALQKTIPRFFYDGDGNRYSDMRSDVACYVTPKYEKQRARGGTLLSLLNDIQRDRLTAPVLKVKVAKRRF